MAGHIPHMIGSLIILAFCVWILTVVELGDIIRISAFLIILAIVACAAYYIKTEADIVRMREEKRRIREKQERREVEQKEQKKRDRREKLEKEVDIALNKVKKRRIEDLEELNEEHREFLINEWRKQIRAYLKRGWTWEKTVEQVCKGIPPT